LTATATAGQNLLEWLNPPSGPYDSTMIRYRTDTYPADPSDGTLLANQAGTLGQHDEFLHASLTNGTTYYYSAFVQAASTFSAPKQVWARPFDTSGPSKWAYSTAASALAPAGIGSVFGVSNDRTLHSMSSGVSGGDWPGGWAPMGMNGSVQHRPGVGTVAGIKRTLLSSQDGAVYMVNAATGGLIWSYDTGMLLQGAPSALLTQFGGSYDLMFAGTREAGANNGLHAFDFFPSAPPAGELGWVFDNLGAGGDGSGGIGIISSQPSVHYPTSRVYFASRAHPTGSTGSVWCVQISGPAGSSSAAICPTWGAARALGDVDASPILRSNKLYVGTNSSRVHALDPDTGSDLWAAPGYTDLGDGPIKGFVSWHSSRSELVVSTTTKVTGLDSTTGAINWQVGLASPSIPLVPFGNPFVYAGSSDGKLYEIDPTGPTLKSVALGGGTAAIGSPAWDRVNSQVVVGADDGRMYAVLVPLP
jgi:outer membrane protein assembly factor BamB